MDEVSTKTSELIDTTKKKAAKVDKKGQVLLEGKKDKASSKKGEAKAE